MMRLSTFVCLLCVILSGCANTSDGTRSLHHVQRETRHVVIPATADAPAQIVPVVQTVESWEDEQTHVTGKTAPDMSQIVPAVAAIGGAATGGWGTAITALTTLIGTTATAYGVAKHLEANRNRLDADEGWSKAEANALKVQPERA